MNESKVVLVLDRDRVEGEAVLLERVAHNVAPEFPGFARALRERSDSLRAALQKEERVEEAVDYRVAWENRDGETRYTTPTKDRVQAERAIENVTWKLGGSNARVQAASTYWGPWVDLPLEESE